MNAPADDWAELDHALGEMAASGSVEVREDGEWLAELDGLHYELRRQGKNSLVHLWSEERNLTRRVLRIKEHSEDQIILEVHRFGRVKPGRLEFLRKNSRRLPGRIPREQFRARFQCLLGQWFPDAAVDSLTAAPDMQHSFSALYVRGQMHEGSRAWALMAVSPAEESATVEGILAIGILWLDWTRGHSDRRAVEGLRLFVPEGSSKSLRERVLGLSPSIRTEVYEFDEPEARIQKMDPADAGNLESSLVSRREIEFALAGASDAIARVRGMVSGTADAVEARVVSGTREVALSFRGLEFARWTTDGLFFGLGDAREPVSASTRPALERLIRQLDLHRNSLAEEVNHPLYRRTPERWLETLMLADATRLDARLNPAHLYSQVPALSAGDRGVLDLLGVTWRGRLVVIELKASEDIQLSIQALDYWLRVRRHQRERDFEEFGYFNDVKLDPQPPLVWLVAPGLRFHSATDTLLKYLSPELQVTRIGLNENWRRGLEIVFRQ